MHENDTIHKYISFHHIYDCIVANLLHEFSENVLGSLVKSGT